MLKNLITSNKNKIIFLECLNTYRGQGSHEIGEKIYNELSKYFEILLEDYDEKTEYEAIKFCLILSQTFYMVKCSLKIFLQESIIENKKLNNFLFWEEFISCNK